MLLYIREEKTTENLKQFIDKLLELKFAGLKINMKRINCNTIHKKQ